MLLKRLRRSVTAGRARRAFHAASMLEALEGRRLLTTDLILDFDGGQLAAGGNYIFPDVGTTSFTPWAGFGTKDGSPMNRTEQILQVLAAVREDFAPFDVRVIWDDRGVNSPYLDGQDQVIMITGNDPGGGAYFGIAADVDVPNDNGIDVGLAIGPVHTGVGPQTFREIRELIDTISHEAGHNFGLSHSSESDSEQRQITTIATANPNLDSRFSPQVLDHAGPEVGVRYSEVERLNRNIGANPILSSDDSSAQTLPLDPTARQYTVGLNNPQRVRIDHFGDRDSFRFTATESGKLAIRAEPVDDGNPGTPLLRPVVTLWSDKGDFITVAADDPDADFSQLVFDATAGTTYWAIVGTAQDREQRVSELQSPATGDIDLIIGDAITPNRAPILAAIGAQRVNEGAAFSVQARATDANAGDVLTYALAPGAPAGMTIDRNTGLITWTPPRGPATASVTVVVTDNNSSRPKSAQRTFSIEVLNVAPVLLNAQDGVFNAAGGFQRSLVFADPGDDAFTAVVDYGDGTPAQTIELGSSRTLELSRNYQGSSPRTIRVTISDNSGGVTDRTFRVTPVQNTQTSTQLVVGRTRYGFNRGMSTLQVKVDPSAAQPRPDVNGVVQVGGRNATLTNGRGSTIVKFGKDQPLSLRGRYEGRGLGYDPSESGEVSVGGPGAPFLGAGRRNPGRSGPPFRRR